MGYLHAGVDSGTVLAGWDTRVKPEGTVCKHGHLLDKENSLVLPGHGRSCRECRRKSSNEWKQRNKDWLLSQREARRVETNAKARERYRLNRMMIVPESRPTREFRMWKDGLPIRLLETLWLEGGWWTAEGLAMRLGTSEETVSRTFYRLHRAGLLESRKIGLATGKDRIGLQSRLEWKALSEPTQLVLDLT